MFLNKISPEFENQNLKYLKVQKEEKREEIASNLSEGDKILLRVILTNFDICESELIRNNMAGLPRNDVIQPYLTSQFYVMSIITGFATVLVSLFTNLHQLMSRRFWIRLLEMENIGVITVSPFAKKIYYDSIEVEIIRRANAQDATKKVHRKRI